MEIFLECLPCILRQAFQASRMSTDNAVLQTIIMDCKLQLQVEHLGNRVAGDQAA